MRVGHEKPSCAFLDPMIYRVWSPLARERKPPPFLTKNPVYKRPRSVTLKKPCKLQLSGDSKIEIYWDG